MERWDDDNDFDLADLDLILRKAVAKKASAPATGQPLFGSNALARAESAVKQDTAPTARSLEGDERGSSSMNLRDDLRATQADFASTRESSHETPSQVTVAIEESNEDEDSLGQQPALSAGTSATDSDSALTEDEQFWDGLVLPTSFFSNTAQRRASAISDDSEGTNKVNLQAALQLRLQKRQDQLRKAAADKLAKSGEVEPVKNALIERFREDGAGVHCDPQGSGDLSGLVIEPDMRLQHRLLNRRSSSSATSSSIPVRKSRQNSMTSSTALNSVTTNVSEFGQPINETPSRASLLDRPSSAASMRHSRLPVRSSSSLSLRGSIKNDQARQADTSAGPTVHLKTPVNPLRLPRFLSTGTSKPEPKTLESPQTPSNRSGTVFGGLMSSATRASLSRRNSLQSLKPSTAASSREPRFSLAGQVHKVKTVDASSSSKTVRTSFAAPTLASLSKTRGNSQPSSKAVLSGHSKASSEKLPTKPTLLLDRRRIAASEDGALSTFPTVQATPTRPHFVPRQRVASVALVRPVASKIFGDGTELDELPDLDVAINRSVKPQVRLRPRKVRPSLGVIDLNTNAADASLLKPANLHTKKARHRQGPQLIVAANTQVSKEPLSGMQWNEVSKKWDGNQSTLKDFDRALSSPVRPALISDWSNGMSPRVQARKASMVTRRTDAQIKGVESTVPQTSFRSSYRPGDPLPINYRVVGNMLFDPTTLTWHSMLGPDEEDELDVDIEGDTFADDEADETKGAKTQTLTINGLEEPKQSKQGAWAKGERDRMLKSRASFVLSDCADELGQSERDRFIAACEEAEARSREELKGWLRIESESDEAEAMDQLWELRRLVLDTNSPFR
ncbi:hypothetical protein OIO90_000917 [Microbotryomycetes sp. JL221]|nr:hypothetical protein OIO90_000917 [Microbotryomycetes sp. JL221]